MEICPQVAPQDWQIPRGFLRRLYAKVVHTVLAELIFNDRDAFVLIVFQEVTRDGEALMGRYAGLGRELNGAEHPVV